MGQEGKEEQKAWMMLHKQDPRMTSSNSLIKRTMELKKLALERAKARKENLLSKLVIHMMDELQNRPPSSTWKWWAKEHAENALGNKEINRYQNAIFFPFFVFQK